MNENENCGLCDEPLGDEKSVSKRQPMHRACALCAATGGIGHMLDHEHFCVRLGDPDAGLDYRTSALLTEVFVSRGHIRRQAVAPTEQEAATAADQEFADLVARTEGCPCDGHDPGPCPEHDRAQWIAEYIQRRTRSD